jgi:hypothetical protein
MSLEQELRQALKRKDPARGFDDRVLSKIASGETAPIRLGTRRWGLASLPIAASLILSFGAAYYVHQQQRQADDALAHAEQTTRNVVLALQIASETISAAQAKVEEITRYEPKNDY